MPGCTLKERVPMSIRVHKIIKLKVMTIYSWEHSQRVHLISMGESTLTKSANAHVDICEAGKRVYFTHDRGENRLFYVKVRRRKKKIS